MLSPSQMVMAPFTCRRQLALPWQPEGSEVLIRQACNRQPKTNGALVNLVRPWRRRHARRRLGCGCMSSRGSEREREPAYVTHVLADGPTRTRGTRKIYLPTQCTVTCTMHGPSQRTKLKKRRHNGHNPTHFIPIPLRTRKSHNLFVHVFPLQCLVNGL